MRFRKCKRTLQITSIQRSNDRDQNRLKLAINFNHSFPLKQYADFQQKFWRNIGNELSLPMELEFFFKQNIPMYASENDWDLITNHFSVNFPILLIIKKGSFTSILPCSIFSVLPHKLIF